MFQGTGGGCFNSAHRPSPPLGSFLIGYPASFAGQQQGVGSQLKTALHSGDAAWSQNTERGSRNKEGLLPSPSHPTHLGQWPEMTLSCHRPPHTHTHVVPLRLSLSWMDLGRAIQHSAQPDAQGAFAASIAEWLVLP